jgi:hypothetical protein
VLNYYGEKKEARRKEIRARRTSGKKKQWFILKECYVRILV